MATMLSITEFEDLNQSTLSNCPREPSVTSQTITMSGTATSSATFNKATRIVRIFADTTGFVNFAVTGASVTAATVSSEKINSNTEYFRVLPWPASSYVVSVLST